MRRYNVYHRTHYDFGVSVSLQRHTVVLRPRDSHSLRLLEANWVINPEPTQIHWLQDVYGNSIAELDFAGETTALTIDSRLRLEHFGAVHPAFPLAPHAVTWPFSYLPNEAIDLRVYLERLFADPDGVLDRWVRSLLAERIEHPTQDMLLNLMTVMKERLPYRERFEEGAQVPLQTLHEGGSCRDLAVLMMESLRCINLATRFVSGYLYVPMQDGAAANIGGGATHAWLQVYLPGAGWVDLDPTNAIYAGQDLIPVAVARDPATIAPVRGSFTGPAAIQTNLSVSVAVELQDEL